MNTPNPLIPQGTLPESRSKTHTRIVVFSILAVHVVLLCVLLLQGCKRTTDTGMTEATNTPPPFEPPPSVFVAPTNQPAVTQPTSPPSQVVNTPVATTPPPTPTTTTTTEPEKEHTVAKGDSFYTLSKKYNVTVRAIAEANPGVDSTRLKIGQKLKIPASSATRVATNGGGSTGNDEKTYTVKSGDTLLRIAKTHGVTVKAMRSANNLRTDRITVGQKLKIPAKAATIPAIEPAPVPAFTPPQPTGTPAPGANI